MKVLLILSVVSLALVSPFTAAAIALALFVAYRITLWHLMTEEQLLIEAHQAEAQRKASLGSTSALS